MEDFMNLYEKLSLRKDERKPMRSDSAAVETNDLGLMLVGRVLAPRNIPHKSIAAVFGHLWGVSGTVQCSPLAVNTTLFQLSDPADRERVLEKEPLTFDKLDKFLLVLVEPTEETTGSDFVFDKVPLWIHAHNVSWQRKTEDTARRIGNDIDRFLEVEKDKWGKTMGTYLRIWCEVDVTKPIKRSQALEGISDLILLQYEKLPYYI